MFRFIPLADLTGFYPALPTLLLCLRVATSVRRKARDSVPKSADHGRRYR